MPSPKILEDQEVPPTSPDMPKQSGGKSTGRVTDVGLTPLSPDARMVLTEPLDEDGASAAQTQPSSDLTVVPGPHRLDADHGTTASSITFSTSTGSSVRRWVAKGVLPEKWVLVR